MRQQTRTIIKRMEKWQWKSLLSSENPTFIFSLSVSQTPFSISKNVPQAIRMLYQGQHSLLSVALYDFRRPTTSSSRSRNFPDRSPRIIDDLHYEQHWSMTLQAFSTAWARRAGTWERTIRHEGSWDLRYIILRLEFNIVAHTIFSTNMKILTRSKSSAISNFAFFPVACDDEAVLKCWK